MAKRTMIGTGQKWADEITEILNDYVDEESDIINKIYKEVAEQTMEMVKGASPGAGEYASGWAVIAKAKKDAYGENISYTVGNPKHYQLTHLLEKGHAVKNQYGEPFRPGARKRVRARRHIKPAEAWGNTTLVARLKGEL